MMKNFVVIFFSFLLLSCTNQIQSFDAFGLKVLYRLPSSNFKVHQEKSPSRVVTYFQFPELHSKKYNANVTADVIVVARRVPKNVAQDVFFAEQISSAYQIPGFKQGSDFHDQLKFKISNDTEFPFQYTNKFGVLHNVLETALLDKSSHIGFVIIYDCTDDLYPENRKLAQELLNSFSFARK